MFLLVKMFPLVKLRYTQTTDSSINYTGLNKNFVYNKQLFVIEPNKKDPWSTGTNGNVQLTAHCTSICTIDEKSRLLGWFSPVFVPSFHLNTDILFHHWTELLWDLNLIIEGVYGVHKSEKHISMNIILAIPKHTANPYWSWCNWT